MEKIIATPCGEIKGTSCNVPDTIAYKGIRYATAGRWEYPKQVKSWEGIYDATEYGHCAYQARAFYDESKNPKKYFYYTEFRKGETYTYSEDCLFLNIWTPETANRGDNLPVIVYIHGGSYTGGCGFEKHFDGPVWPTKGVIAVTINYRLGPWGFACLPELKEEAGHTGNYGLFDQLTAIKWVSDNITAFGGNPDNITIMGQSAGAMSVQHLCTSPLSDGLFHKAVMSSGCGLNNFLIGTAEKSYGFWREVMKRTGCDSLQQFRNLAPEKLYEAWLAAKNEVKGGAMSTFPVKDELFIVSGAKPKVIPYMVGSTSHDMAPPVIHSMAKKWGCKNEPTFVWLFDRMLPGDENGAWHSSDLWYWFGTLPNCWRPMEENDYRLSDQMTSYLCNFAKKGNPDGDDLPIWKAIVPIMGRKKVLILGEKTPRMGRANLPKLIKTMLTNKAVGE
ncbi:MAG: carboxylesterase family protein [Firmicutes bacterium]|nr:carboxylesterase family protein [Bacillota bacterium]